MAWPPRCSWCGGSAVVALKDCASAARRCCSLAPGLCSGPRSIGLANEKPADLSELCSPARGSSWLQCFTSCARARDSASSREASVRLTGCAPSYFCCICSAAASRSRRCWAAMRGFHFLLKVLSPRSPLPSLKSWPAGELAVEMGLFPSSRASGTGFFGVSCPDFGLGVVLGTPAGSFATGRTALCSGCCRSTGSALLGAATLRGEERKSATAPPPPDGLLG